MPFQVRYTKQFTEQLEAIHTFICEEIDEELAIEISKKLLDKTDSLADFAYVGISLAKLYPNKEITARYRLLFVAKYVIGYHVEGDTVFIDWIHHQRENWLSGLK